ncbi:MAG: ferrous iron transport protein A [Flavobacteriales bacterium]|nr:ferrous iron transport protein A [Flavobacteriales bacterium]
MLSIFAHYSESFLISSELTVNDLAIGQHATVTHFNDAELGHHLMEMGVIPGETITLERIAPMGDPIAVRVSDLLLMMRRQEASMICVEECNVDL